MHQEKQERESEMESLSMVIEENDAEMDRLNGMIATIRRHACNNEVAVRKLDL